MDPRRRFNAMERAALYLAAAGRSLLGTPAQRSKLIKVGLWITADGGCQFHEWRMHQRGDYRPRIPDRVRFAVYQRDGHACVSCGATEPLSLDHIWPWSLGGEDTVENFQTLCIPCNCRKGNRIAEAVTS
jgi:hypothetical protein